MHAACADAAIARVPPLRLGAALWIAGMVGVVVLTLIVLPQFLQRATSSLPHGVLITASLVQSSALLALAAWIGAAFANDVGLRAPAIEAALAGDNVWRAARPQLLPGVLAGLVAGAVLFLAVQFAPAEMRAAAAAIRIPAAARLLYGGITEEILMRWGLMTLLVWLTWRFLQRRDGAPRAACVLAAIITTAVLFGAGHLPAVAAMGLPLSGSVVGYVLIGNTVPGLLFGMLYWRCGLESAFIAHATAHAVVLVAGAT